MQKWINTLLFLLSLEQDCMLYQSNQGLKIIPTVGLSGFNNSDIDIGLKSAGKCRIYAMYKYSVKDARLSGVRSQLLSLADDNKLSVRFNSLSLSLSLSLFSICNSNNKTKQITHKVILMSIGRPWHSKTLSTTFCVTRDFWFFFHSVQNKWRRTMYHVSLSSIHLHVKYRMF